MNGSPIATPATTITPSAKSIRKLLQHCVTVATSAPTQPTAVKHANVSAKPTSSTLGELTSASSRARTCVKPIATAPAKSAAPDATAKGTEPSSV